MSNAKPMAAIAQTSQPVTERRPEAVRPDGDEPMGGDSENEPGRSGRSA
jgi:hypothetical protein